MLERLLQKARVLRSFEDVVIDAMLEHLDVRGGQVYRHCISEMNTNIQSSANQYLQKAIVSFKPQHPKNIQQAVGERELAGMDEMVRSRIDYTNGKGSCK